MVLRLFLTIAGAAAALGIMYYLYLRQLGAISFFLLAIFFFMLAVSQFKGKAGKKAAVNRKKKPGSDRIR
jgi:hypothetical protein